MTQVVCTPSFISFNDTATTEIYTLSLHDALPISSIPNRERCWSSSPGLTPCSLYGNAQAFGSTRTRGWNACCPGKQRSEEHTSELQSQFHLVCRLLLEKKNSYLTVFAHHLVVSGL